MHIHAADRSDSAVWIPADMPLGNYQLEMAILQGHTHQPAIQLANI